MRVFFLLILFSLPAFAQEQFQLQGQFPLPNKQMKKFTLHWTEQGQGVQGIYQGHGNKAQYSVQGTSGERGRTFTVSLPDEHSGIRTLHFLVPNDKISRTVGINVISRDKNGKPQTSYMTDAELTLVPILAQRQEEEESCAEGFGQLAGFCGEYRGFMAEVEDQFANCNLTSTEEARLLLTETGDVELILGRNPGIINRPKHKLGRILTGHPSSNVDLLARNCSGMEGVGFPDTNCKVINLSGSFSSAPNGHQFRGVYLITDEQLGRSCRYRIDFQKSVQ